MQSIKRFIRILAFICLILLAGIGVGISGGVPIPFSKTRRDAEKDDIELVESKEEESEVKG